MLITSSVSPYLTTVTSGYWISEDKLFLFQDILSPSYKINTYKMNDFKTTAFLNLEINHFIFEKIYLCRSSCSEAQVYFYYKKSLISLRLPWSCKHVLLVIEGIVTA